MFYTKQYIHCESTIMLTFAAPRERCLGVMLDLHDLAMSLSAWPGKACAAKTIREILPDNDFSKLMWLLIAHHIEDLT